MPLHTQTGPHSGNTHGCGHTDSAPPPKQSAIVILCSNSPEEWARSSSLSLDPTKHRCPRRWLHLHPSQVPSPEARRTRTRQQRRRTQVGFFHPHSVAISTPGTNGGGSQEEGWLRTALLCGDSSKWFINLFCLTFKMFPVTYRKCRIGNVRKNKIMLSIK
jgi:hypothetical protein